MNIKRYLTADIVLKEFAIKRIFVMVMLCCFPLLNIFAFNYNFLSDSAISYFTDKDRDLMMANVHQALNTAPDNKKLSWRNPTSDAWGYAIPSHTTRENGTTCRQLFIYNNAHKVPGETTYKFCKINHEWKIVS